MVDRHNEVSVQSSFSGKRASEIVGITYRQLDYWARTELLVPSISPAKGSGSRRQYSYQDLLELKVIKTLLDAGIRLESVRSAFAYLKDELGEDIASASLVISASSAALIREDGALIELIASGQGVLNILPLGGVQQALDAKIVSFATPSTQPMAESSNEKPVEAGSL